MARRTARGLLLVSLAGLLGAAELPRLPSGLDGEERRQIEIFRRSSRSVVNITTVALRRSFFSLDVFEVPRGIGSGFIWDRKGHVVTNYHVIEGGDSFSVTLPDGQTWDAEVVGIAPAKDLAVLRVGVDPETLVPAELGSSTPLAVGQRVLAIGNPFGLDLSLTVGVVSALGRELWAPNGRTIRDVIQTDAAINPGNSGGPLLNSLGRVIGVNSAIYSPSGASAGIGFAVPIDIVRRLVPQMIEHGHPVRPGIGIVPLSTRLARRYGLEGVVVREVRPGGPAARAGVVGIHRVDGQGVLGDQIVSVDGVPVEDTDGLLHVFERKGVGTEVTLELFRAGQEREVKLELEAIE